MEGDIQYIELPGGATIPLLHNPEKPLLALVNLDSNKHFVGLYLALPGEDGESPTIVDMGREVNPRHGVSLNEKLERHGFHIRHLPDEGGGGDSRYGSDQEAVAETVASLVMEGFIDPEIVGQLWAVLGEETAEMVDDRLPEDL